MKEQIEKILKDSIDNDDYTDYFGHEKAARSLQKLFLSKQIELLGGLMRYLPSTNRTYQIITEERAKLQSELKQLG
jgi:hypothetical protein